MGIVLTKSGIPVRGEKCACAHTVSVHAGPWRWERRVSVSTWSAHTCRRQTVLPGRLAGRPLLPTTSRISTASAWQAIHLQKNRVLQGRVQFSWDPIPGSSGFHFSFGKYIYNHVYLKRWTYILYESRLSSWGCCKGSWILCNGECLVDIHSDHPASPSTWLGARLHVVADVCLMGMTPRGAHERRIGVREGCEGPGQMIKWAGIGNHSDKGGRGITCLPNFLKSANSLFSQLVSAGAVKGWFIASCYSTLRGSISLKSSLKFLCFKTIF